MPNELLDFFLKDMLKFNPPNLAGPPPDPSKLETLRGEIPIPAPSLTHIKALSLFDHLARTAANAGPDISGLTIAKNLPKGMTKTEAGDLLDYLANHPEIRASANNGPLSAQGYISRGSTGSRSYRMSQAAPNGWMWFMRPQNWWK